MTRNTNARIAGVTFLAYIAAGITSLMLTGPATRGDGIAARLANVAQHATDLRITIVLGFVMSLSAIVLGVTLYAITRDEDRDLAMLGLTCRVLEGGVDSVSTTLGLLWLVTATGPNAPDTSTAHVLGTFLLMPGVATGAVFFAVGSTLFCSLLLRGRMVPVPLAWLGVLASLLLVVILPLQISGLAGSMNWSGAATWLIWFPMLVFEVTLALWFIIKGVAAPQTTRNRPASAV
jgi:hypothetical protein